MSVGQPRSRSPSAPSRSSPVSSATCVSSRAVPPRPAPHPSSRRASARSRRAPGRAGRAPPSRPPTSPAGYSGAPGVRPRPGPKPAPSTGINQVVAPPRRDGDDRGVATPRGQRMMPVAALEVCRPRSPRRCGSRTGCGRRGSPSPHRGSVAGARRRDPPVSHPDEAGRFEEPSMFSGEAEFEDS
jgi:hypothetical protein